MDITTAAVAENEIVKHEDFQFGFESLIRNTAALDHMLVSSDQDYIVGGEVTADAAALGVRIGKIWGNGTALALPIFSDTISDIISITAPAGDTRIDTVQVQAAFEEYDEQRRAFYNSEIGQPYYPAENTPTKKRLVAVCEIKQGIEGQGVAPQTDSGWLKLAEITVEPGASTLGVGAVHGVTALNQGEENEEWTAEKTRTFQLVSDLALKSILTKEHTADGEHRARVIHASNIDFGVGSNQVNSLSIPLGKDYKNGTDEFKAAESIYASLVREVEYRKAAVAALTAAVALLNENTADMVHEAPADGRIYGRKNKLWAVVEESGGGTVGDAIEALKLYSKKTLMLTNSRIVDRRRRGWDIGLAYLSSASRWYHFDTDLNDQNQASNITITSAGGAPALVGKDDTNGEIYFNPAVMEEAPFEMMGRSLYGYFTLESIPQVATKNAAADMWIRLFGSRSKQIIRFGNGMETITFRVGTKGAPEADYSEGEAALAFSTAENDGTAYDEPGADALAYSAGESPFAYCGDEIPLTYGGGADETAYGVSGGDGIEYSEAGNDGTAYSAVKTPFDYDAAENDGIMYSGAETSFAYDEAGVDIGNAVIHKALDGTEETASLDDIGVIIMPKSWLHIAVVARPDTLSFFINDKKVVFGRRTMAAQMFGVKINPAQNEFNLDELMLDETTALPFDIFSANTENHIPWAGLDYEKKWFVLEAQDADFIRTNLFESAQFEEKVLEILNANRR